MAQRPLLPPSRWDDFLGVPTDEGTLIRHYTLGQAELDLIQTKIAPHNQLGLAIQLCLMRHPGRAWRHGETLPASFVTFVAEQVAVPSNALANYMQRDTTRREHATEAQRHLGLHPADRQDRRAALKAAIAAAASTDKGRLQRRCENIL